MQDAVIEAIEQVTLDVFALMIGVDITKEAETPAVAAEHCLDSGEARIVSSFNLTGAVSGTATVYYSLPLAKWIASQMLPMEESLPPEQVLDAAGEIANMIVGGVKNSLETMIGSIQIGTPTVALVSPAVALKPVAKDTNVTFRCRDAVFNVSISFEPVTA